MQSRGGWLCLLDRAQDWDWCRSGRGQRRGSSGMARAVFQRASNSCRKFRLWRSQPPQQAAAAAAAAAAAEVVVYSAAVQRRRESGRKYAACSNTFMQVCAIAYLKCISMICLSAWRNICVSSSVSLSPLNLRCTHRPTERSAGQVVCGPKSREQCSESCTAFCRPHFTPGCTYGGKVLTR